jgi:large subunit ribosomal protein L10
MRQEKEFLLEDIKSCVNTGSYVIVRYNKFSANLANSFRRETGKLGNTYEVVRKRVLIKAADSLGVKIDPKSLDGHIGLVFGGKDILETTKFLFKFGADNDKVVEVIGGTVDGKLYNGNDMEKLSKLPSMNEMRAQLLGLFVAPLGETLGVMDAVVSSVVYCLANKADQAEKG